MGNSSGAFTEKELEQYEVITYLKKNEILAAYSLFRKISPIAVDGNRDVKLPMKQVLNGIAELRESPFADRLCREFASSTNANSDTDAHATTGTDFGGDENGNSEMEMSFEDLLDMFSVLSPRAPQNVKAAYAFKMFDQDDDGKLSPDDIRKVIMGLIGNEDALSDEDMDLIVKSIFSEVDLDGDNFLSVAEFEHAMSKIPDFETSFRIRLV